MEIWKEIKGYEGLYQVSNMGRVKSLKRYKEGLKNSLILVPEKLMKIRTNGNGYNQIQLYKDGVSRTYLVHRLVAQAFLPNPDNKPEVNHINTVKTDNRVWVNEDGSIDYEKSNLEWCTKTENANNPLTKEHYRECNLGERNPSFNRISEKHYASKPVIQFTKDGYMIRKWNCMRDILRCKVVKNVGDISACCRGKLKTTGGYVWKYYDTDTYLIGKLNNRLKESSLTK